MAADGKTLLVLQDLVLSGIQIPVPGHGSESHSLRDESQNLDGYSGMAWTPQGNIVYISESGRNNWDLMEVHGDGSKPRRLAESELPAPYSDPAASPPGDFIALARWLGTNDEANIWRMDSNGGNMKRLTNGKQDTAPSIPPDGKWIVCGSVQDDRSVLLKVPNRGGPLPAGTQ